MTLFFYFDGFHDIVLFNFYFNYDCSVARKEWTVDLWSGMSLVRPGLFNGGNQPTSSDHTRDQETVEEQ